MAVGLLPAPGSKLGPCAADCKHLDCARLRRDAAHVCHYCGGALGYERIFFNEGASGSEADQRLVHVECADKADDALDAAERREDA